MSLAKLTSISTQTLSLLLERQRMQTLPSYSSQANDTSKPTNLHLPQITLNLNSLRTGILALEAKEGRSDAVTLLRNQHERMRSMLGAGEDDGVERFVAVVYLAFTWPIVH
jgi:syntaxin 8